MSFNFKIHLPFIITIIFAISACQNDGVITTEIQYLEVDFSDGLNENEQITISEARDRVLEDCSITDGKYNLAFLNATKLDMDPQLFSYIKVNMGYMNQKIDNRLYKLENKRLIPTQEGMNLLKSRPKDMHLSAVTANDGTNPSDINDGGGWVLELFENATDWYKVYEEDGYSIWEYTNTTYSYETRYTWVDNPYVSHYHDNYYVYYAGDNTSDSGYPIPNPLKPIIEDDPSFINTEAECIRDRLFNAEVASILKKLTGSFELDESRIRLVYKVENIRSNGLCRFYPPGNDTNPINIQIVIDEDRLASSPIDIARTILHEAFHAHIYAKLWDTPGIRPELENNEEMDFMSLWDMYEENYGSGVPNSAQHNYMADHYRDFIVTGLMEFMSGTTWEQDFLNSVQDIEGWVDLSTYLETKSWGGLTGTDVFEEFKQTEEYNKYLLQRNIFDYLIPLTPCSQI